MLLRTCFFITALAGPPCWSRAAIVYHFANGGILEGDGAGDTAVFPADSVSNVVGTITTLDVSDGARTSRLNENTGSLGVFGGAASTQFDGAEKWTFSWDVDSRLDFIDFDAFTAEETFTISSPAWIGRSFSISSPGLSFHSLSGTLTFSDAGSDAFDLESSVSGDSRSVAASQSYTFTSGNGTAAIGSMSFSVTSVPEPSSLALSGILGLGGAAIHRRRRRDLGGRSTAGNERGAEGTGLKP